MAKAEEIEKKDTTQAHAAKEKAKAPDQKKVEGVSLEDSIEALLEYGGFDLMKETIDGAGSLDPDSKARKNIFFANLELSKRFINSSGYRLFRTPIIRYCTDKGR